MTKTPTPTEQSKKQRDNIAIFDDPVEVRQRFRCVKESSAKQSQNSNEVIMTFETPGRVEPCYNAPHCSLE